ncbi:MAG: sulfocyanin-like copper-binding protein [Vulcanimicrobiaceae bacterium]
MRQATAAALAAVVVALAPLAGRAATTQIHPSWMTVNAAKKSVHFVIKMAENGNNGTLNFNGYAHGEMTITVPTGWHVSMHVINAGAGAIPHSLEILPITESIPVQGSDPPVFSGAETIDLTDGMPVNSSDDADFVAAKAGRYWMFCGVPDHGIGGMYDYFVVSTQATAPTVTVAQK